MARPSCHSPAQRNSSQIAPRFTIDQFLGRLAPVVTALQAMRAIALVVAVTVVAEVGDFRQFATARQLMAYFGLVPCENS